MYTRRSFVAASTSLVLPTQAGVPVRVETAPGTTTVETDLNVEASGLTLAPGGGITNGLRFAGEFPIVRLRKGQDALFRILNSGEAPVSLQWHGLRGCGALDDAVSRSGAGIAVGASRSVRIAPLDSGTSWFHASPDQSNQTARGLRGVMVVDEPVPPTVDQDLAFLFADWLLSADQRLLFGSAARDATAAAVVTTNGQPGPQTVTCAPGSRLRLRLVNGSMQRVMLVACEGGHPMILAIDGQPSELFAPIRETVPIAPGGRFDYLLDLPAVAGPTVTLILKSTERVGGRPEPERPLVIIRTSGDPLPPKPPMTPLSPNPSLPRQIPLEASKRAELIFDGKPGSGSVAPSGWTVNGLSGMATPAAPVLKVRRGGAVTLGFTNRSAVMVPIRVIGHAMRLLHAKDDGWEPYWRDTVLLPPGSRNHVAFMADVPGRWPIESGFDDVTRAGLRCWFDVTA